MINQCNNRRSLSYLLFCEEVQSLQYSRTKQSLWLAKDNIAYCAHIQKAAVCWCALLIINWLCMLFTFSGCGVHYTIWICTVGFLYPCSKMLGEGWKLLDHCTSMDMKSSSRCLCGLELHSCVKKKKKKKKEKNRFLAPSGSVCKLPFCAYGYCLSVKITRRTRW